MKLFEDTVRVSQSIVETAGAFGVNGFIFDINEEAEVSLESEITDHYVEDGTSVQDHIALRPEKVTLRGFVGELAYKKNDKKSKLKDISQKLTTVSSYLPAIGSSAKSIFNSLASVNYSQEGGDTQTLSKIVKAGSESYKAFKNVNIPKNEQEKAFIFFEALRNSRELLTVHTPFRDYTNMAIETIKFIQSSESRDGIDIEVTLKRIRFAHVSTTNKQKLASKLLFMSAKDVSQGLVSGVKASVNSYWGEAKSTFGKVKGFFGDKE